MAKIDKDQYSKEEWRKIRDERRLKKKSQQIVSSHDLAYKNYVLCLKHGPKYSSEYVNKLYNMVQRNTTIDLEFACLTDNPSGINSNVKILPLPAGLQGWWCKPYMFSNDLPIKGTILYMDLDVVIAGNIDKLFQYELQRWCVIRDFTRAMRPKWQKYNSSVVRFQSGQLDHVWENFEKDKEKIQRRLHGDQDWLYEATRETQAVFWPDSWILSWKWEVRKDKQFAPGAVRGNRKFKTIEHVKPRVECCVCVFHGDPNPHNCDDPWVIDNWH